MIMELKMENKYKGKYRGLSKWEEKEYLKLSILVTIGILLIGGSSIGLIIEGIYWGIYAWNHDYLTRMQMAKITTPYYMPLIILLIIGYWLIHAFSDDYECFNRKIDRYKRNKENDLVD